MYRNMTLLITPLNNIPPVSPTYWNFSCTCLRPQIILPFPQPPLLAFFPPRNSDLLKKTHVPWSTSKRTSRYEEVLLTRLQIGHTRLIHSFFYLCLFTSSSCQYCHQVELSVEHFFSCPVLTKVHHSDSVSSILSIALSNNQEAITKSLNGPKSRETLGGGLLKQSLPSLKVGSGKTSIRRALV